MAFLLASEVTETAQELADALAAARIAEEDLQPILRKLVLKLGFFESVPDDATVNVAVSVAG